MIINLWLGGRAVRLYQRNARFICSAGALTRRFVPLRLASNVLAILFVRTKLTPADPVRLALTQGALSVFVKIRIETR